MQSLLNHASGSVTAPAGCGKTHLIAETLRQHNSAQKPILVLTHTNAGVAALRKRFNKLKISSSSYVVMTLDGWTLRLVAYFPERSKIKIDALQLNNPRHDYPAIREASINLMKGKHLTSILKANYHSCIIDEYQDCSLEQHQICLGIKEAIPTYILGDPMQAIFGWAGTPIDWNKEVLKDFPSIGVLSTPWRWKNENNTDLGNWLLKCRTALENGHQINLNACPSTVTYVHFPNSEDYQHISKICSAKLAEDENAIIICNARIPSRHQKIASGVPGASVVENADLSALVDFADNFSFDASNAAEKLITFASNTMTGLGASNLQNRLKILISGTQRKAPTALESLILAFYKERTPQRAVTFLSEASRLSSGRIFRPDVLRGCIRALNQCAETTDFKDIVRTEREKTRMIGRSIRKRAVGSTLLVKGLEAEVAIIIDTDVLSAKDLYVAMTRGSRRLIICSTNPILNA